MRVFFLGKTPLGSVTTLEPAPVAGDVVCYLRQAQNLRAGESARLAEAGIAVVSADDLMDGDVWRQIDALGDEVLSTWFMDADRDYSRLGKLSLGKTFAMELARHCNPRQLIAAGEMLRRVLDAHPDAEMVLSDISDGDSVFTVDPEPFPVAGTLAHVARELGRGFGRCRPVDPVPTALERARRNRWPQVLRSLLGGLRPRWLLARIRVVARGRRRRTKPVLYMFLGRAQELVARRLARVPGIELVVDRFGIEGAGAIRFDHLLAAPRIADVNGARRLLRALRRRAAGIEGGAKAYRYGGIDYGRVLFAAFRAYLGYQVWLFLVFLAQARRLQRLIGFTALFVNAGGSEPMGALIALNEGTDSKIYLMPHGMNLQRYAYLTAATDNPHVTYLSYGSDHVDYYRSWAGTASMKPPVLTGNPMTVAMNAARAKGPDPDHGRRLLILSFGHLEFWNAGRTYACDRYYADIFSVLPALADDGWTFTLRSHPRHPQDLEHWIAAKLGMAGLVRKSAHATFEDALFAHDVVVSNLSSTCYESLYAGWPTIFYEPDYAGAGSIAGIEGDPMLTGLPAAHDLDRPVTNDPAALRRMIVDSLDRESMVSVFPRRFAGALAPRFIGPDPERADAVVADYLARDILSDAERPAN